MFEFINAYNGINICPMWLPLYLMYTQESRVNISCVLASQPSNIWHARMDSIIAHAYPHARPNEHQHYTIPWAWCMFCLSPYTRRCPTYTYLRPYQKRFKGVPLTHWCWWMCIGLSCIDMIWNVRLPCWNPLTLNVAVFDLEFMLTLVCLWPKGIRLPRKGNYGW